MATLQELLTQKEALEREIEQTKKRDRADAIAKAHRDELGKVTVELRGTKETLKVSQAYAWRFKPM